MVDEDPQFEMSEPFVTALRALAEAHPEHPALSEPGRALNRAELETSTNRLARAYASLGVTAGSYLTIGLPNGIEMIQAMVAAWKLGATPQPVSHRIPTRELEGVVALSKPPLIVGLAVHGYRSVPAGFSPDGFPDEPLPVVVSERWKAPMSGGSTGRPKLIVSTQEARLSAVVPFAPLIRLRPRGRVLVTTPLSHNMGIIFTALTLVSGGELIVLPRFDAAEVLDEITRRRITWTCLVPTMMHRIARLPQQVRDSADLSSIDAIVTGAAPCPAWLKDYWCDWIGPDHMVEFYAATELQMLSIADGNIWREHPGSVGRIILGEVQVRDEDERVLPEGEVGELWARRSPEVGGPYFYLGAEPHRDAAGWETVGDMGRVEDGFVYLADRKMDMAVVGGSNVYPAEVEAALLEHPLVASSCVVGIPDDEYGSVLHAILQTSGPVSDDELVTHLRERIAPYKVPRTFERTEAPLRDDSGKVRRSWWRDHAIAQREGANR